MCWLHVTKIWLKLGREREVDGGIGDDVSGHVHISMGREGGGRHRLGLFSYTSGLWVSLSKPLLDFDITSVRTLMVGTCLAKGLVMASYGTGSCDNYFML